MTTYVAIAGAATNPIRLNLDSLIGEILTKLPAAPQPEGQRRVDLFVARSTRSRRQTSEMRALFKALGAPRARPPERSGALGPQKKTRASTAKRATRTERADEAARERACKGVRGGEAPRIKI